MLTCLQGKLFLQEAENQQADRLTIESQTFCDLKGLRPW